MGSNARLSEAPPSRVVLAVAACLIAAPSPIALAQAGAIHGDVFDQFHRFTDSEHKAYLTQLPGELVDPFTGNLRIVQEDLVLRGKAGLDLRVLRTYSSKIWGRSDLLDMEPLLAEKEQTVLGYGWALHMGRLRAPNAIPPPVGSDPCSGGATGSFPVFEASDGTSQVFYPVDGSNKVFRSKSFWRLERDCLALGAVGMGSCVWSDAGVRYELPDSPSNQYQMGATPMVSVSRIVDRFGNHIDVSYIPNTGAVSSIRDTYYRTVLFEYVNSSGQIVASRPADGLLYLKSMTANAKTFLFDYTTFTPAQTEGANRVGLPGPRKFLTAMRPPEGPGYNYEYAFDKSVPENQYALSSIQYPSGGKVTYGYDAKQFFTGRDSVPFPVVVNRTELVAEPGQTPTLGTWTYDYVSPGYQTTPPPDNYIPDRYLHITTITRPDMKKDTHRLIGFGYVASANKPGYMSAVGLPTTISRADGAEHEGYLWDSTQLPTLSTVPFGAPVYSGNCGAHIVWDMGVTVPVLAEHQLWRDGALFTTTNSDFDEFGQPRTVVETGEQHSGTMSRVTDWTYQYAATEGQATLNLVRGLPLSQHVCAGPGCFDLDGSPKTTHVCAEGECVDNTWTYLPDMHFALNKETRSGVTTTFDYHISDLEGPGNLKSVINALGVTLTLNGYSDGWGIPTTLANPVYSVTRTAYWEGWLESETDGKGNKKSYTYDLIGRPKTTTPPGLGPITSMTYSPDGTQVQLDRGTFRETRMLDGWGRPVKVVNSEGVTRTTKYDAMGRIWFQSYPWDPQHPEIGDKFVYDGLSRVRSRTKGFDPATETCNAPNACNEFTEYFKNCVIQTIDRDLLRVPVPDQIVTSWCDLAFGDPEEKWLGQMWDASGDSWAYGYNAAGKLTEVVAPAPEGNRTIGYDGRYFPIRETTAEGGIVMMPRNAIGQAVSRTDERPVTATFEYDDPLSRLSKTWYQSGTDDDTLTDFDSNNNLWHSSSVNGGAFVFTHDELDRLKSTQWSVGGKTFVTGYEYNPAGCLETLTYPSSRTVTMTCDSANRPRSIRAGPTAAAAVSDIVTSVTYHPSGQVEAILLGNGLSTTAQYDQQGRLRFLNSAPFLKLEYAYDGNGNVTELKRDDVSRTMEYDKLNRLLTSIAPSLWGSTVYDYDLLGNRLYKSEGNGTANYVYDGDTNRLEAVIGGQQTLQPMTFTWSEAGRLVASSDGVSYRYDGAGKRVRKSGPNGDTLYHYDAAGRLLSETSVDGAVSRDFIYLGGKLVAVVGCVTTDAAPCNEIRWYHTDALGSVVAQTDQAGAVVAKQDYQAWGEPWDPLGQQGDRQYNGRVFDPGTGFHDYGARMYWPQIGRFISVDPAEANLRSPASFNRYSYVYNNPYKFTDPNGKVPFLVVTGAIGAVAGGAWGMYSSYQEQGHIDWGTVGRDALIGGGIGLGLGAGAGVALAGSATASAGAVGAGAATLVGAGGTAAASLTQRQQGAVDKITNILSKNFKDGPKGDIAGAVSDMVGNPIAKPGGGSWDHVQDLGNILRGLRNHSATLENVAHPDAMAARQQAVQTITKIEEAVKGAGL